jgi:hypothetical protein
LSIGSFFLSRKNKLSLRLSGHTAAAFVI